MIRLIQKKRLAFLIFFILKEHQLYSVAMALPSISFVLNVMYIWNLLHYFCRGPIMRPSSQTHKNKSSHGTEREFGGTLGELRQTESTSTSSQYISVRPINRLQWTFYELALAPADPLSGTALPCPAVLCWLCPPYKSRGLATTFKCLSTIY